MGRVLSTGALGRRTGRGLRALWLIGLVGLLALPALPVGAPASPGATPVGSAQPSAVGHVTTPAAAQAPRQLPGADPTGAPFVDGAALALQLWRSEMRSGASLNGTSSPATLSPGPERPAAVPDARPALANGTIDGRVYDYTFGRPVSGAIVSIIPVGLTLCVPSPCASVSTGSDGSFSLSAPAGSVIVAFTAGYYLSNRTWVTVAPGAVSNLGTLYLIHDGYATGIIEDNLDTPQPIAGAILSASSRDGTITASPGNSSSANGSFVLAVPPMPSEIQITSPGDPTQYLENVTFTNVTPYQVVDLGVIHLEGGVPVTATYVDRITGLPINPLAPAQLNVCTDRGRFCVPEILHTFGSAVTGWGVPGPSFIRAYAIGYLENQTQVRDIPATRSTVDLGTIYLTPLAVVEMSTNVTGGPPPASPWALGRVTSYACSLDGEQATFQIAPNSSLLASPCTPRGVSYPWVSNNSFPVGTTQLLVAPPLRDVLFVVADSNGFPYALNALSSLTPLFPTAYSNLTWLNASPDRVTYVGSVNLTGGAMLSGTVGLPAGSSGPYSVGVCSTDIPSLCAEGGGPGQTGCPTGANRFCVAAPPGPVEVTVDGANLGSNRTWVEVPRGCCAQDGVPIDIGTINLTGGVGYGNVSGQVVGQTGGPGSATILIPSVLLTVQACPIGPPPVGLASPGCTNGVVDGATGDFNLTAPAGWDRIYTAAPGYEANWTWVYVQQYNTTGTIELAPQAVVVGTVVDARGGPVYSAVVQLCLAGLTSQCRSSTVTNSFGQYNLTVRAGPLPWGTYEVSAAASGYATGWTWTNTTPGGTVFIPPIVLYPIGSGVPGPPSATGAATNASVGAWVDGRLVDARTGLGVPEADLSECPLVGGVCLGSVQLTGTGGDFNVSLLLGQYYLQFTLAGYTTLSTYVNATGTTLVHLGPLLFQPDPWVAGRVVVHPWETLVDSIGLGAPVTVEGCDATMSRCDVAVATSSDGGFNVSVPMGTYSTLVLVGEGVGGYGSDLGGFEPASVTVNVVGPYQQLPASAGSAPSVAIFGAVLGYVTDGSTWNATAGAARAFCGFCTAVVTSINDTINPYETFAIGGGGFYTALLDSHQSAVTVAGEAVGFWPAAATVRGSVAPGSTVTAPTVAPMHDGWITLRAVTANTSTPIPYVFGTASEADPANGTVWGNSVVSGQDGYINVTAPVGTSVSLNLTSPGFFPRSMTLTIRPSTTNALGLVTMLGGAPPSVIWVNSTAENVVSAPPTLGVVDAVTGAALPNVAVVASDPSGGTSTPVLTNGLGQFLMYRGVAPSLVVQGTLTGYDVLDLYYNTTNTYQLTVARALMDGNGVVAGRVIAEPGHRPLYGVPVQVCPYGNACSNVGYTNASGDFWVEASRGYDTVTVLSEAYLTNVTPSLSVTSDGWQWVGEVPVYAFGGVFGTVRGIPSGAFLAGANVSVCSPFGSPSGPCGFSVPTDANGSFDLPVPPGNYIVSVAAVGYNTSYIPVNLLPGENDSLGTVFLLADGIVQGMVRSAINGQPIPNASLIACARYQAGTCSPITNGTSSGAFAVLAPPGPVQLTTSAAGYFDNFTNTFVRAGDVVTVGPINMTPVAADIPESVAGTVVDAATSAPIAGAYVTAWQGPASVATTATNQTGAFFMPLVWGTYSLVAGAAGYVPGRTTVAVHSNLTGLRFPLEVWTYSVSGTVRDAVRQTPVVGATLLLGATSLATTAPDGSYSFGLANGTYQLTVQGPAGGAAAYAALPFLVVVAGAPVHRDLDLTPTTVAVVGEVVDALSGLPIASAGVSALPTGGGAAISAGVTLGGAFSLALPPGTYAITASAPGYDPVTVSLTVPNGTAPLTFALQPIAAGVPPLPWVDTYWPLIVVAAVVGLGVGLWLYRRRPPPPPPPPRWTLDDLNEPVDF